MLSFASQSDRREILDYFSNRFGIPNHIFDGLCFVRSGNTAWAVSDHPRLAEILEVLNLETTGVPLLRMKRNLWKPTTAGLQLFGRHASRNTIDLDDSTLQAFLKDGSIQHTASLEPGFVIITWRENLLGCGLYSKGMLRSQIPGDWWQQIALSPRRIL